MPIGFIDYTLQALPQLRWSRDIGIEDFAAIRSCRLVAMHADIPAGVFNVITAQDPQLVGDQLVADPRVDMVSFTGSTAGGKHIMARAAQTVKKG